MVVNTGTSTREEGSSSRKKGRRVSMNLASIRTILSREDTLMQITIGICPGYGFSAYTQLRMRVFYIPTATGVGF